MLRSIRNTTSARDAKAPRVTLIKSIEIAGPKLQKHGYEARKEAARQAQQRQAEADTAA